MGNNRDLPFNGNLKRKFISVSVLVSILVSGNSLKSHLHVIVLTDNLSQAPRYNQRATKHERVSINTAISLHIDKPYADTKFSVSLQPHNKDRKKNLLASFCCQVITDAQK